LWSGCVEGDGLLWGQFAVLVLADERRRLADIGHLKRVEAAAENGKN
jgi:hypothetical protein